MKKQCSIAIVIALFLISFSMQSFDPMNGDSIGLLQLAHNLLAGEKYYIDFFESNPPLCFWLGIPALGLARLFHLSDWIGYLIEVHVFILISILLCHALLKGKPHAAFTQWLILIALLFLPTRAFGEREHLTVIFMMPYLFLLLNRLEHRQTSIWIAGCIGILAGIGFSLKPYFLLAFLCVEIFYAIRTKRILSIFRTETITIVICGCVYLTLTDYFQPQYFSEIYPIATALYIPFFEQFPLSKLLLTPAVFTPAFTISILFLYFFFGGKLSNDRVVLCLAAIGFYAEALWAGQPWYYHFYPTLALLWITTGLILFNNPIHLHDLKTELRSYFVLLLWCLFLMTLAVAASFARFTTSVSIFSTNATQTTPTEISALQKIFVFSSDVLVLAPTPNASLKVIGRFYQLSELIPGVDEKLMHHTPDALYWKQVFFNLIMTYFEKQEPVEVLVNLKGYHYWSQDLKIQKPFMPFLLSDPQFAAMWQADYRKAKEQKIPGWVVYRRTS